MRLIDEKGKLFGIINIIDIGVILIFALLLVGGARRLKKTTDGVIETKKALITIEVSEVRTPTIEGVIIGDPLYYYDKGGLLGEIVDKRVENYKEPIDSGDGRWILADVPDKYVVYIVVEADVTENPDVVVAGGEHIRIGTQFGFKNRNISIMGTILGIEIQ